MAGSLGTNNNVPNAEVTSNVTQMTEGNSDGTIIGQSGSDPIGFYGQVPQTQKATSLQAIASGAATSSASFFGAVQVNATSYSFQKCQTSALTVAASVAALGTGAANLLAEVVDTLVGLGVWKGNS